jgi:hypothetical protein
MPIATHMPLIESISEEAKVVHYITFFLIILQYPKGCTLLKVRTNQLSEEHLY